MSPLRIYSEVNLEWKSTQVRSVRLRKEPVNTDLKELTGVISLATYRLQHSYQKLQFETL